MTSQQSLAVMQLVPCIIIWGNYQLRRKFTSSPSRHVSILTQNSTNRSHLRDCIDRTSRLSNPDEGTLREIAARARIHLCKVYNEQKVSPEEAEAHDRIGRDMLKDDFLNLPACLTGAEDEMVILDGLQTEIARYTGRTFLPHIQNWCRIEKGKRVLMER